MRADYVLEKLPDISGPGLVKTGCYIMPIHLPQILLGDKLTLLTYVSAMNLILFRFLGSDNDSSSPSSIAATDYVLKKLPDISGSGLVETGRYIMPIHLPQYYSAIN